MAVEGADRLTPFKSETTKSAEKTRFQAGSDYARHAKEETGLDIRNLQSCGVVHWAHNRNFNRYIVFLYRTSDFSGELLAETEEGKVFWVDPSELDKMELAENFDRYLPMFLKGCFCEVYGSWNEDDPQILIYK